MVNFVNSEYDDPSDYLYYIQNPSNQQFLHYDMDTTNTTLTLSNTPSIFQVRWRNTLNIPWQNGTAPSTRTFDLNDFTQITDNNPSAYELIAINPSSMQQPLVKSYGSEFLVMTSPILNQSKNTYVQSDLTLGGKPFNWNCLLLNQLPTA
jgi:hypothetical protein